MRLRPPVTFFGSKSKLAPRIIAHFPPRVTYCEVFVGSAAVLLAKDPSDVEILNDPNGDIVNLFRVLREASLFRRLKVVAESTLYARAEFDLAGEITEEPVERARRYLVRRLQTCSFLQPSTQFELFVAPSVTPIAIGKLKEMRQGHGSCP